jgi:type II secretory pathway component PulL
LAGGREGSIASINHNEFVSFFIREAKKKRLEMLAGKIGGNNDGKKRWNKWRNE